MNPETPIVCNHSAEHALIGSALYDNANYARASEFVRADQFHLPAYSEIWSAIGTLISEGRPATPVTLKDDFPPGLLADCLDACVFGPEIDDYARIVSEMARRRALIEAGNVLASRAPGEASKAVLFDHEQTLEAIRLESTSMAPIVPVSDEIDFTLDPAEEENLVLSGWPSLDEKIAGFERGALSILAGGTGMGKSALNICLMGNIAAEQGSVGMVSLDMTKRQVNRRLAVYLAWKRQKEIGSKDSVPTFRQVAQRRISDKHMQMLRSAMETETARRIFVDDTPGLTTHDLDSQIRSWKRHCRRHGLPPLAAVFVDHIGQLQPAGRTGEGLYQKTSTVSNELLTVAKRHKDISLIVLCQLNKRALQAKDRPNLGDLRESGHIGQDASMVLMVHRHEWHLLQIMENEMLDEEERGKAERELKYHRGKLELIVAKNRQGATGAIAMKQSVAHNIIQDARRPETQEESDYGSTTNQDF